MEYPKLSKPTSDMFPIGIDENNNLVYQEGINPYVIRTTDRTNFKKCRRLWDFTSKQRKNYEPVRMNKNLAFGIAIHKGLENLYEPVLFGTGPGRDACVAGFVAENTRQMQQEDNATYHGMNVERKTEYLERAELGIGMLKGYTEWAQGQDDGWNPVAVELKFQIPVPTSPTDNSPMVTFDGRPVVYQVRLDLVATDSDGRLWVWDHKTAANVTGDLEFLDLDTQLSSYILALQGLLFSPLSFIPEVLQPYKDVEVAGLIYNELAKTVPHPPKQNKNGALSQDKRQNTSYELYVKELDKLGLDSQPYQGMLDHLAAQPETRFRRTPVTRSPRELRLQLEYIIGEARDMTNGPTIYPSPNKFTCRNCDFKLPSTIANEGGDVDFILHDPSLFRLRPDEEEEVDGDTV